jgi:hypothetical protein
MNPEFERFVLFPEDIEVVSEGAPPTETTAQIEGESESPVEDA